MTSDSSVRVWLTQNRGIDEFIDELVNWWLVVVSSG